MPLTLGESGPGGAIGGCSPVGGSVERRIMGESGEKHTPENRQVAHRVAAQATGTAL
jgi:hypothetical protein